MVLSKGVSIGLLTTALLAIGGCTQINVQGSKNSTVNLEKGVHFNLPKDRSKK